MNWGKWIIVSFVLFAIFIGTLVTVCMQQDMPLVSQNYYEQELAYQNQIERKRNAETLIVRPKIEVSNSKLTVTYPDFNQISSGELKLMRPSDARLDETFKLLLGDGNIQSFELNNPQRGMYKVNLSWSIQEKEYFIEETLYLN